MNYFEQLTQLQKSIGYHEGEISLVALLGSFGESGEVINEWLNQFEPSQVSKYWFLQSVSNAIYTAGEIDALKKAVRDAKITVPELEKDDSNRLDTDAFDEEISDQLYYLNALAINRGKTLEDYAKISFDKVLAKKNKAVPDKNCSGGANSPLEPLLSSEQ